MSNKAKAIMIQGTTSNAGKSLITAALCRIFARDGYKVAPFKSQNMALNSYITEDGLEMGRAQVVQAEAAGVKPDVRMNPILLKPTSDQGSQVIVNGKVMGNMRAMDYYKNKPKYIPAILEAYESLAEENDIIVIEGAGSPAEINLKENDIVNMGMAKMAGAPVLVVGDIDRGGVFASLYGTYMLQDAEEKTYIKGNIINKFRGDVEILKPGVKMLEDLVPVPVVGVVPYLHLKIDDEDSLSETLENSCAAEVDIGVIRLPKISNFTDFNAFEILGGTPVRYITSPREFGNPDLIILPGTKNTIEDLKWLRESGLEALVLKYAAVGNPVFGVCGGYQILTEKLSDPHGVEGGGTTAGMGLLKAETVFETEKVRTRVHGEFRTVGGIFAGLAGKQFEGYEIHMGVTGTEKPMTQLTNTAGETKLDGQCVDNVYGSYVHGIFDSEEVVGEILESLCRKKGIAYTPGAQVDIKAFKEREYDKLADAVAASLDMEKIYKILDEGMI